MAQRWLSTAAAQSTRSMSMYFHPLYTGAIDKSARFPRDRYDKVHAGLLQTNAPMTILEPADATREALLRAHDPGFVDSFLTGKLSDSEKRRIGLTPWLPEIVQRTLALVGGSLCATDDALRSGGVAANMAGGTHHAAFDHGSGYCIFNDLAVCALHAVHTHRLQRVSILDLDVHQGDGTASIFAEETRVFTASVHCQENFPFRKQQSDLDIGLPKGTGDEGYLGACREALDVSLAFSPQLLLFQAGVDALEADALGHLNVTREGMSARNAMVFEAARHVPVVVFMGGGYSKPIERTVEAFVDLFVAAAWEHHGRCNR